MKQLLLSILFVGTLGALLAQTTPSKTADIRTMLNLSGQATVGAQVMETMTVQFKQMMPQVPAEFWKEAMKEMNANALIELIIPIYEKHYTHEDVKQLIAFYNTPIGKKLSATLPAITQESMAAGQEWGQQVAQDVMTKLKQKGYIKE